jgi:hypothetical protein
MKKLIIIAALIMSMVSPVLADNWTITYTVESGTLDHLVLYHKPMVGTPTAQAFIDSGGFAEINLDNVSPKEFVVSYPEGTVYGMYARAFGQDGSSTVVMDNLSPTVWKLTALGAVTDAHYEDVIPTTSGEINITINVSVGR